MTLHADHLLISRLISKVVAIYLFPKLLELSFQEYIVLPKVLFLYE